MASMQGVGWGLVGAGTTMLARRVTRWGLHDGTRTRLPAVARHPRGVGGLLMLAAIAGAFLAVADVLQDQRREVARRATT
jgi:hypothetical protein